MEKLKALDAIEIKEISGGNFWAGIAVSLSATFLYEIINDWDNNVKSFKQGFNSFK
ncbi:hypothetical protein [Pleomorphovibrio marinus]|uniref:hypothetical protein n=1 Tax=Pleomorphovibrio marinus TaxID=2164132 RepID=UPI0013007D28|nr:hypothetical protein [Pleomorphovibrio marinus]